MIQRVVENSGLEWFAVVGLILFLIAFILVVIAYAIPLAQMVGDGIFFPGSPAFPT